MGFFGVLLVILGVIVAIGVVAVSFMSAGLGKGRALTFRDPDLASLPDGTYRGSHRGGRWSNIAEVTVENHRITGIRYPKDVMVPIPPAREKVIESVLSKQSLSVDTLSSATVTSKAYLKSIEAALEGANKQ